MLADLAVDRESNPNFAAQDRWNPDEEEEDDGGELNIIDKSASISGNGSLFPSSFRCHATLCRAFQLESLAACCPTGVDVACSVYCIPFWPPPVVSCACWRGGFGRRVGYASSPVLFMRFFSFFFIFGLNNRFAPLAVTNTAWHR